MVSTVLLEVRTAVSMVAKILSNFNEQRRKGKAKDPV